jgi:hypothetical protein
MNFVTLENVGLGSTSFYVSSVGRELSIMEHKNVDLECTLSAEEELGQQLEVLVKVSLNNSINICVQYYLL